MEEGSFRPSNKSKRLSTLPAFFRFCAARRWLVENPVSYDLKPPKGASRAANKAPFSDEEVERIIKACDGLRIEWENETGTGVWTGEDVKDLVWLMLYTGYRISDAAFFDMRRLDGNQVYIRAKKNGGEVFAYVPDRDGRRRRGPCSKPTSASGRSRTGAPPIGPVLEINHRAGGPSLSHGGPALASFVEASAETTRTSMSDPLLLIGCPALLAGPALVACYLPARRSTRINPVTALRAE